MKAHIVYPEGTESGGVTTAAAQPCLNLDSTPQDVICLLLFVTELSLHAQTITAKGLGFGHDDA